MAATCCAALAIATAALAIAAGVRLTRDMSEAPPTDSAPLFHENGASWFWLLTGPAAAAAMLWIQKSSGYGMQWMVPVMLLLLVSGFIAIQVKAARVHTSVELTRETLRQGTETIAVADIVRVLPETAQQSGRNAKPEKWQSARAIGELSGVPRGRVGIGLRLTNRRTVQAWARRHRALRAALTPLIEERTGGMESLESLEYPDDLGPEFEDEFDGDLNDLDDLDGRGDGTGEPQW